MTFLDKYPATEGLPQTTAMGGPAGGHRRGVLQVIWSRRLIVLISTLVLTVASFVYVELAPPTYLSGARIQVEGARALPKALMPDENGQADSRNRYTDCEIIRSTQVLNDALNSLKTAIPPIQTFAGDPKNSLNYMVKHVTATVGKQDDLITITFESEYPDDIPRVVDAIANAYIDFQTTHRRDIAREVLTILQREKNVRDGDLSSSLQAMLNFKEKHPELGFGGDKGNIILQRLERLSTALTEAEFAMVEAKSDHDALVAIMGSSRTDATSVSGGMVDWLRNIDPTAWIGSTSGPTTAPAGKEDEMDRATRIRLFFETKRAAGKMVAGGQDDVGRLQAELNDLQFRLEALKREYPASSPAVQSVESSIKTVRQQIVDREAQAAALQVAIVEQQYKSAQDRLTHIAAEYDKQLKEAQRLNQTMVQYAPLESAYEQSKKLVEIIDDQLRGLNMTDEVGAMNIRKIEPAARPDKPYKPDKPRIVGVSCAVGLLLGVGLAMLWDWRDPRLSGVEEIAAATGLSVMAMLPEMKLKRGQEEFDFGRNVLQFPHSPASEAYRGLRTTLMLGMDGDKARTILVTSPGAQEGKSTLVSNLAVAMAQAGQRTLVLDADFRKPRQHELFNVSNELGLSAILQNGGSLEKSIVPSAQAGLDILPAGPTPLQPSELLGGRAFLELLRTLGERYDQILIDSPPVTAVSDSLILAARSDATLLVVRIEQSHRNLAEEACKSLLGVGARMCGVVVNGVSIKKLHYGYYTDYNSLPPAPL
jgi:capsular exopolysaccharide synthesis family protein